LKPKIAIVMAGISDLTGSGGAERRFADTVDLYLRYPEARFEVYLVTDDRSLAALRRIGKLTDDRRVVTYRARFSRWRIALHMTLVLAFLFFRHRFALVHIALPNKKYLPVLFLLGLLPVPVRPRFAITVVNAHIGKPGYPTSFGRDREEAKIHELYVRHIRLDGILTWYEAVKNYLQGRYRGRAPVIMAAQACSADFSRFQAAREKLPWIIFAGRLDDQKHPFMFIEGVALALRREPELFRGWRFFLYGRGPLENEVKAAIAARGLGDRLALGAAADLAPVFAQSKLYVSTQEYENFPSLAMHEAMAAGNAVIARNVGQTSRFVHEGENGFLMQEETAEGLAAALVRYAKSAERHAAMAAESVRIATVVYGPEKYLKNLEEFWTRVLDRDRNTG
jgi:glycosyltransferase involved in cell wall biosynthesis